MSDSNGQNRTLTRIHFHSLYVLIRAHEDRHTEILS